jgi:hypothetical protein
VSSIAKLIQPPAAFDPEAITAMSEAYERALKTFEISAPNSVKEVIASRIISTARTGERDPTKLCDESLAALDGPRK